MIYMYFKIFLKKNIIRKQMEHAKIQKTKTQLTEIPEREKMKHINEITETNLQV